MKVQLALDAIELSHARHLLEQVHDQIDILEFGTPFLLRYGLNTVSDFRQTFPELDLLADIKIMDGGEYMANLAFGAGADYVTVLAAARDETVAGAVRAARAAGATVFADLIATPDPAARARQVEALGVDGVCVHSGFEPGAGADQLAMLESVRAVVGRAQVSVAGGISASSLPSILAFQPDIVIVGGSLTTSDNPRGALEEMRSIADRAAVAS